MVQKDRSGLPAVLFIVYLSYIYRVSNVYLSCIYRVYYVVDSGKIKKICSKFMGK